MKHDSRRTHGNRDRWLVSYADFITLLFGFFVVLYAFARADQKKQKEIPVAISDAFQQMALFSELTKGSTAHQTSTATTEFITEAQVRVPVEVKQDLERIKRELTQSLSGPLAAHAIAITMRRDGLVISLREAGFFPSGSAVTKPESMSTLGQIAASLAHVPYELRIEGHTDNVPIHNAAFESNWELSTARATNIARLFLEWRAISPHRLSAAGYGEFHPMANNSTAEGRAQNRRVDIVVLPRTTIDFGASSIPMNSGQWRKVTDGDEFTNQFATEIDSANE